MYIILKSKFIGPYIALRRKKLNQARSKPDAVDRPVRTAHTTVTIISIMVHNKVNMVMWICIAHHREHASNALPLPVRQR